MISSMTLNKFSTTLSATTTDDPEYNIIIGTVTSVLFLGIIAVIVGIMLIPIIIRNNRRKMLYSISNRDNR